MKNKAKIFWFNTDVYMFIKMGTRSPAKNLGEYYKIWSLLPDIISLVVKVVCYTLQAVVRLWKIYWRNRRMPYLSENHHSVMTLIAANAMQSSVTGSR